MMNIETDIYEPMLSGNGFVPCEAHHDFSPVGQCWKCDNALGAGYYWTYGQKDLFGIKIHDFTFQEDNYREFIWPETLSITYYMSISGEELEPYRRITPGCVKSFIGGSKPYKVMTHSQIPVRSVGIEIAPAYYENYLLNAYQDAAPTLKDAFGAVDQTMDFEEMAHLLLQIYKYRGDGLAARLFYEGKVTEAVSLVIERWKSKKSRPRKPLSAADRDHLLTVTSYINDHYMSSLPLEQLARIACMGTTKFKKTFKNYYGCTVTEYVQTRRIGQAEHLLLKTDLAIGQIAKTVGYANASRFTQLFHTQLGVLPSDYRKACR